MIPWMVAVLTLSAAIAQTHTSTPTVGCRSTHEWVSLGEMPMGQVAGTVFVQYSGGTRAALSEAQVLLARVEPFIETFASDTNERGEFAIPNVPEGRWRINICQPGFKALEGTVLVSPKAAAQRHEFVTELDW